MERVDLNNYKFKRSEDKDNLACNSIISYFTENTNEEKTSTELMELILLQISDARDLVLSIEETEEHIMLDRTQKYLKIKIDKLKCMDSNALKGNTFNDCIQYLESVAQDALKMQDKELGKQIGDRLSLFINELKKRYYNN